MATKLIKLDSLSPVANIGGSIVHSIPGGGLTALGIGGGVVLIGGGVTVAALIAKTRSRRGHGGKSSKKATAISGIIAAIDKYKPIKPSLPLNPTKDDHKQYKQEMRVYMQEMRIFQERKLAAVQQQAMLTALKELMLEQQKLQLKVMALQSLIGAGANSISQALSIAERAAMGAIQAAGR